MDTTKINAEKRSETPFIGDAKNVEGNSSKKYTNFELSEYLLTTTGNVNKAFETDEEIKQTNNNIDDAALDMRTGGHAAEKLNDSHDNEEELYDDKRITFNENKIAVVIVDDVEGELNGKEEGSMDDDIIFWKKWCRNGLKFWCRKYFWEGMSSEGGGAIVFPVMTLAFGVKPSIARDFSVMIQSFGMTCGSFTLIFMKVHLEISVLIWCSLGGLVGVIFGLELIDPNLTPPQKKMGFVSIWFSFAFALFLLNRHHKRPTFNNIQNMNWIRAGVLAITGFVGGCFTSFAGSGVNICSFSILTLLFRLSEKVATPTSVVLMAINAVVCFFWRGLIANDIQAEAWEYVMVCIPIVVFGVPFGSLIGSHFHRLVLAALIYVIDTVALVSAFAIVPQTPVLAGVSVGIILFGVIVFFILITIGQKIILTKEMKSLIARKQQNLVKGKFHSDVPVKTTEIEKPRVMPIISE